MGVSVTLLRWSVGLLVVVLLESDRAIGCLEAERVALLELKAAFNSPNGTSLPSWDDQHSDCCEWERVTCDNTTNPKRVTQLLLNSIRDSEQINAYWSLNASYLLPFLELQVLDLSWNYITGVYGVMRSKNLRVLRLNGNMLTEVPSFDALPSLEILDLSFTSLKNFHFLQELSTLSKLEVLDLGNNLLAGSLPESIGNLTSLQALSLSMNSLVGSLPAEGGICKLKNLQHLDLGHNQFIGELPFCFSNLTSLHVFDVSHNMFEGVFPSLIISSLKSLEYVSLSNNYFHGSFSFNSLSNHFKLEVFDLFSYNSQLKVETENPPFIPSFQLKVLRLSNCTLNELTKGIPSFLLYQNDLRVIDLSYNSIIGRLPLWLLKNNTRLEFVGLGNNFLTGPFELNCTSRYPNMNTLDVSHNPIKRQIPPCIGSVFPNLRVLNMSKSALKGTIPASMGDMSLLMILDFSANNLSGQLPEELVRGGKSLEFLKLSHNNLSGPILSTKPNLGLLRVLRLDNNHFTGEISNVFMNSSLLRVLDLSNNHLNGELPGWIGSFQQLTSLVLSQNSLQGAIPLELCKLSRITYLDLSKNNFTGTLPSCFDLLNLRYLHLQGNQFSGPLPNALAKSELLLTLDLMNNRFSGEIPNWIGTFSKLRVLLLKGNYLEGSIPSAICQLKHMSILDLSHNNLSGQIPSCLSDVSSGLLDPLDSILFGEYFIMVPIKFTEYTFDNLIHVDEGIDVSGVVSDEEQEVEFMSKRRLESYKGNILYYMSGIDLSCNMLTGPIPPQIGYLGSIHTLNLSKNHLSGSIPETFSNLKQVESLDLSNNRLSGHIPSQLVELYSLALFSVAYNNLSGMTPESKYQFATFGPSSYEGNPLLCGPPLDHSCTSATAREPAIVPSDGEESGFKDAFLWSFAASFVVAFLSVIAIRYFNPYFGSRTSPCMVFNYIAKKIINITAATFYQVHD